MIEDGLLEYIDKMHRDIRSLVFALTDSTGEDSLVITYDDGLTIKIEVER
jgi:hypothetical protein